VKTERRFCASGDIMKVTKKTIECYNIRQKRDYEGWAKVIIDANGEHGHLVVTSDFGDWQFSWSFCGMPFKEFLTTIAVDYVANKFRTKDYFETEKTTQNYRKDILENRRQGGNKEFSRKLFNEVKSLEDHYGYGSRHNFEIGLAQCSNILRFYDSDPPIYETYQPLFLRFWNEIWLPFVTDLKKEIMANELAAVEAI
jgi:hypothetical protein